MDDCDAAAETVSVDFAGQLTFAENGEFRRVLAGLDDGPADEVVFDLSDLRFIDSSGMGLLLVARESVGARGGRITLRNAQGQVRRMLNLAKFDDFFALAHCAQFNGSLRGVSRNRHGGGL